MKTQGFTIIEIILVVGIFGILLVVSLAAFGGFRDDSSLQSTASGIVDVLRVAQNRTVSSENADQYGVYFNVGASPEQYILFRGSSYASRVVSEDEIYTLPDFVEFSTVSLGAGQEVVFDRIDGTTSQQGTIIIRSVTDAANTRTIAVGSSGSIEVGSGSAPSDASRITDTRHMHVTYNGKDIDTANEVVHLSFPPTATTFDIDVASNLSGGQIFWEGDIDVGGELQTLKIHTHILNDAVLGTEFSIHRDARFNTQALTVELNGGTPEDTGTLVQYDAAGTVTPGTSIYVLSTDVQ